MISYFKIYKNIPRGIKSGDDTAQNYLTLEIITFFYELLTAVINYIFCSTFNIQC